MPECAGTTDCGVGQGISRAAIWTGLQAVLGLWDVVEDSAVFWNCFVCSVFGLVLYGFARFCLAFSKALFVCVQTSGE